MRSFTDEQIDAFLEAYVGKYSAAIERMHFVMRHPFRDNDEQITRGAREISEIAQTLEFFKDYADREPSALHHLRRDVARRVAGMLGPIGTYKTED
jgi:hypothetical protein